jgi:hypothetical protein
VESTTRQIFPGVVERFQKSAEWHKEHGAQPLFGAFWNLCINARFPGQKRIHCLPHADRKNIVGICALLVFEEPGSKLSFMKLQHIRNSDHTPTEHFNHTKRSWLVIWQAGVVIELPPWTLLLYPSSLLYHFNIDIDGMSSELLFKVRYSPAVSDIKFVNTIGDEYPTPANSRPMQEGDEEGRGSLVYFNQATMYQSSETGYHLLRSAVEAGHSGKTDFSTDAQQAFTKYSTFIRYPNL